MTVASAMGNSVQEKRNKLEAQKSKTPRNKDIQIVLLPASGTSDTPEAFIATRDSTRPNTARTIAISSVGNLLPEGMRSSFTSTEASEKPTVEQKTQK
jgi:hypothetical protein